MVGKEMLLEIVKQDGLHQIGHNLEKITNILFSNKRKMINKNIRKILNEKEIKSLKALRLNIRPGEIKPEIYYKITEIFERKMNL